jgi:hypothetical protein
MNNIQNFEEFEFQLMVESLNSPYDIEWLLISDIKYNGKFNNGKFLIVVENFGYNCWFFKFYQFDEEQNKYVDNLNPKDNLSNYSESTKVLGTVRKAFFEFIELVKPNGIFFIAIDKSKSRKSIYDLFCNQVVLKYRSYIKNKFIDDEYDYNIFCLYNDKKLLTVIRKTIYEKFGIIF